jgi:hypothetical protein
MEKPKKKASNSAGLGLFKLPDGYEKMSIEEQQQALTDIMREVGKNLNKLK